MHIGIPKEIKEGETRVAVSPAGATALVRRGHAVSVQAGAGEGCGWSDKNYREAGARIVRDIKTIYRRAQLICKVKEPQPSELPLLKKSQILFTFLHLAGYPRLIKALQKKKVVAIAYETVQKKDGSLPLLRPMSEVAGRVAALLGSAFLRSDWGGKGVLLSEVMGESCGTVSVVGCGHAGRAAIEVALGLGATVLAADVNAKTLKEIRRTYGKRVQTFLSNSKTLGRMTKQSDLLILAVLVAGRRAPQLITRKMVQSMEKGSVILDVSIDQGGCVETMRATSIKKPVFKKYGVLHCAIPNLPALAPRTASHLLSKRVQPYLLKLANYGWEKAIKKDVALAKGVNLVEGKIVYPGLL